jgi:hypothetical protein
MDWNRASQIRIAGSGGTLTRRELLQQASCVLAMGVVPRRALLAIEPVSPVMATLSNYMAQARNRALPDEVAEQAKQHILDTLA